MAKTEPVEKPQKKKKRYHDLRKVKFNHTDIACLTNLKKQLEASYIAIPCKLNLPKVNKPILMGHSEPEGGEEKNQVERD
jgi:hypothetical protein